MSSIKAVVANNQAEYPNYTDIIDVEKPAISDTQVLIKAVAIAVNQIDYILMKNKSYDDGIIIGQDISGIVEQVGKEVSHVRAGDYVSAYLGGEWSSFRGAFSEYVAVEEAGVIKYDKGSFKTEPLAPGKYPAGPINTFEGAASTTFSLATVAVSFSHELGFEAGRDYSDQYILIWGGATTVGSIAIQLAKKVYGFKVVTTASPKNKDLLAGLGADVVLDYHDEDVTKRIKEVGDIKYGLDAVGSVPSFQGVYDATAQKAIIDNVYLIPPSEIKQDPSREVEFRKTFVHLAIGDSKLVNGDVIKTTPELLKHYRTFWLEVLPKYVSKLDTTNLRVLEPGLQSVNTSMKLFGDGDIRAEKIVFRIK